GRAYLVMEWIDGRELNRHHESTPLSTREVIGVGILIARALKKLGQLGIFHRDLKPGNILLRRRPPRDALLPELEVEPVIIDFGIATKKPGAQITGTPAYMSPEQARGETEIDHRSDLYSLGATMFELLVGRPPHQGASPLATLARLATTPAPRASSFRANIPPRLDDTIDALLQTDPSNRPSSASGVEEMLTRCLEDNSADEFPEDENSSRLGTGTSRLVTTIVAMGLGVDARKSALVELGRLGAEAVPLGSDAVVAHLGVTKATGGEARAALEFSRSRSLRGAAVGIASGRARLQGSEGGRVRPVGEVVDRAATLAR